MSRESRTVRFGGRILYLTEDAGPVRRQLGGEDLAWDPNDPAHALRNEISTDEITPGWVCFHHDESLGRFAYLGITCAEGGARVTPFGEEAVRGGGFAVSVAGRRRGKGSSREQAPYAEQAAGIRLLVAESFERIYRQNAINLGMLVDDGLLGPGPDPARRGDPPRVLHGRRGRRDAGRRRGGGPPPVHAPAPRGRGRGARPRGGRAPDDARREDPRAPRRDGRGRGHGRRLRRRAGRGGIRPGGLALFPRVRHADGGERLRAGAGCRRAGRGAGERPALPRPPRPPRRGDAGGAPAARAPRARGRPRRPAGGVRARAGRHASRRGRRHLPLPHAGALRPARSARRRLRFAHDARGRPRRPRVRDRDLRGRLRLALARRAREGSRDDPRRARRARGPPGSPPRTSCSPSSRTRT